MPMRACMRLHACTPSGACEPSRQPAYPALATQPTHPQSHLPPQPPPHPTPPTPAQDTDAFCRGTLCAPEVADYCNATFLCWGGDLRHSDAFRLSASLRAAAYPYVALLAFSGTRWGPARMWRVKGCVCLQLLPLHRAAGILGRQVGD